jgi:hypothetical protein
VSRQKIPANNVAEATPVDAGPSTQPERPPRSSAEGHINPELLTGGPGRGSSSANGTGSQINLDEVLAAYRPTAATGPPLDFDGLLFDLDETCNFSGQDLSLDSGYGSTIPFGSTELRHAEPPSSGKGKEVCGGNITDPLIWPAWRDPEWPVP